MNTTRTTLTRLHNKHLQKCKRTAVDCSRTNKLNLRELLNNKI